MYEEIYTCPECEKEDTKILLVCTKTIQKVLKHMDRIADGMSYYPEVQEEEDCAFFCNNCDALLAHDNEELAKKIWSGEIKSKYK